MIKLNTNLDKTVSISRVNRRKIQQDFNSSKLQNVCFTFIGAFFSFWQDKPNQLRRKDTVEKIFPIDQIYSKGFPVTGITHGDSVSLSFVWLLPICHQHSDAVIFIRFMQSDWPINHTGLDFFYPLHWSFIIACRIESIG